jgi:hypothetical protein|tara:strand:- start:297 stop:494 length:198 start_codon:yes stop_codon:yes gene_type:complete
MIYTGIYIDKEGSYRTSVCVSSLNDRAAAWTEIAATLTEDDKLIMLSPGNQLIYTIDDIPSLKPT